MQDFARSVVEMGDSDRAVLAQQADGAISDLWQVRARVVAGVGVTVVRSSPCATPC
jgi:hypothetical protein